MVVLGRIYLSFLLVTSIISASTYHQRALKPSILRSNIPYTTSIFSVTRNLNQKEKADFILHLSTEDLENIDNPKSTPIEGESVDDALIRRISEEVFAESGVDLDQLINPSKVVNLERDIMMLNAELETGTLSAKDREDVESKIEKKTSVLQVEKRAVMRGWLKGLFVGQSVLAGIASLAMVYDAVPGYHLPLAVQVLGFWMWWLFIIPSLRARKPKAEEKKALDIAFLASPLISFLLPFATKDVAIIWWANAVVVGAAYAVGYLGDYEEETVFGEVEEGNEAAGTKLKNVGWELPKPLGKVVKALDYGSGQERGARK